MDSALFESALAQLIDVVSYDIKLFLVIGVPLIKLGKYDVVCLEFVHWSLKFVAFWKGVGPGYEHSSLNDSGCDDCSPRKLVPPVLCLFDGEDFEFGEPFGERLTFVDCGTLVVSL